MMVDPLFILRELNASLARQSKLINLLIVLLVLEAVILAVLIALRVTG